MKKCVCEFIVLAVWTLLCAGSATAGNKDGGVLRLAHDGKSDYAIVLGEPANSPEAFAAKELQSYLEKASGARLPIVKESELPSGSLAIYVGWTAFARGHDIVSSKFGDQEWLIQTVGKNLVLTGGRPVGSLYAVYEFLETKVGCRWLDRDTEVVPRSADLAIGSLEIRGKPAFWQRSIYTGFESLSVTSEMMDKEGLFLVRNKATHKPAKFGQVCFGSPGGCHTFYEYSKDFPADHPEYFSMNAAGKRERATSPFGPGQLCLSNPEVRKLLLARLKTYIAQDREEAAKAGQPAPRLYDISANDTPVSCSCPACRAIVDREGSASGPLLECINQVADGVKDAYPDVMVMTFAYQNTLETPKTVRPHDNVIIRLAQLNAEWTPSPDREPHYPDYFRPMSHPINRVALTDITAWSKLAKHMAIWDYWVIYLRSSEGSPGPDNFPSPYVNTANLQPDLQLFLHNHVESCFVQCEPFERSSFEALKLWLGQKLLQNPNQSVAPLVRGFMDGYYGAASPQMAEYLNYLERQIEAVPATMKLSSTNVRLRPYLTLEFFTTVHRLMTEAEERCGSDKRSLLHVQQELIPVSAAIFNMWSQLERQLPKDQAMPFNRNMILQQYADSRQAEMEQFYYGNIPERVKNEMQENLRQYRELPALEQKATGASK